MSLQQDEHLVDIDRTIRQGPFFVRLRSLHQFTLIDAPGESVTCCECPVHRTNWLGNYNAITRANWADSIMTKLLSCSGSLLEFGGLGGRCVALF